MATPIAPRVPVEAPPREVLPFGLLSAARGPLPMTDSKMRNGVFWEAPDCRPARATCQGCGPKSPLKVLDHPTHEVDGIPVTIYKDLTCALPSRSYSQARAILEEDFPFSEPRTLESIFWSGVVASNCPTIFPALQDGRQFTDAATTNTSPTLTSITAAFVAGDAGKPIVGAGIPAGTTVLTVTNGTTVQMSANATATATNVTVSLGTAVILGSTSSPMKQVQALNALEGAMGLAYGGVPLMHVPRGAVHGLISEGHLAEAKGDTLFTKVGTPVAVGAGYSGAAPDGSAPPAGGAWLHITTPVTIYRSGIRWVPEIESQAVDRAANTLSVIAERDYVLAYDTCAHFAVLMTTTTED